MCTVKSSQVLLQTSCKFGSCFLTVAVIDLFQGSSDTKSMTIAIPQLSGRVSECQRSSHCICFGVPGHGCGAGMLGCFGDQSETTLRLTKVTVCDVDSSEAVDLIYFLIFFGGGWVPNVLHHRIL